MPERSYHTVDLFDHLRRTSNAGPLVHNLLELIGAPCLRIFLIHGLRQRIEFRLAVLYLDSANYGGATKIINPLLREVKRIDDKVDVSMKSAVEFTNQQLTQLRGELDRWHQHSAAEFSTLGARIDALGAGGRPQRAEESSPAEVVALPRAASSEDYKYNRPHWHGPPPRIRVIL